MKYWFLRFGAFLKPLELVNNSGSQEMKHVQFQIQHYFEGRLGNNLPLIPQSSLYFWSVLFLGFGGYDYDSCLRYTEAFDLTLKPSTPLKKCEDSSLGRGPTRGVNHAECT